MTYYEILGVARDASYDDVKRAWRQKAHQWHPDKFLTAEEKLIAHERFVEIMEAYVVLIDAEKRAAYDSWMANAASNRLYAGYENASPAADQKEASDMYQAILRETPWEFTATTLVVTAVVIMFPLTLLGFAVLFLIVFGFMKEPGFWGRLLALWMLLANGLVLVTEVALLINLYHRIRRIVKRVILMVRGRRIFAQALTARGSPRPGRGQA